MLNRKLINILYAFAFALVNDEKKSKEITSNAFLRLSIENGHIFTLLENQNLNIDINRLIENLLLTNIYKLSEKYNLNFSSDIFFSLSRNDRAVLFLKNKLGKNIEEIMEIVSVPKLLAITSINRARSGLCEDMPS